MTMYMGPVLVKEYHAVVGGLAHGNLAFIRKLHCHWLSGFIYHMSNDEWIVVIQDYIRK